MLFRSPKQKSAPAAVPVKSVITGSMEDNSAPWEENSEDGVTQEMLTAIINDYTKDKSDEEKRKCIAVIKKINNGSLKYQNIADPNIRKELYNHFWNLKNEI